MKKTYLEPVVTVVNLKIENLMEAISKGGVVNGVSGDARRSGSWDDED